MSAFNRSRTDGKFRSDGKHSFAKRRAQFKEKLRRSCIDRVNVQRAQLLAAARYGSGGLVDNVQQQQQQQQRQTFPFSMQGQQRSVSSPSPTSSFTASGNGHASSSHLQLQNELHSIFNQEMSMGMSSSSSSSSFSSSSFHNNSMDISNEDESMAYEFCRDEEMERLSDDEKLSILLEMQAELMRDMGLNAGGSLEEPDEQYDDGDEELAAYAEQYEQEIGLGGDGKQADCEAASALDMEVSDQGYFARGGQSSEQGEHMLCPVCMKASLLLSGVVEFGRSDPSSVLQCSACEFKMVVQVGAINGSVGNPTFSELQLPLQDTMPLSNALCSMYESHQVDKQCGQRPRFAVESMPYENSSVDALYLVCDSCRSYVPVLF
jgi:hypothetical protein